MRPLPICARTLTTLATCVALASGCLAPNDANPESDTSPSSGDTHVDDTHAADPDATSPDSNPTPVDATDTSASPDTTDAGDPNGPVDPHDPAVPESRAWCVPQARSATPTYVTPSPGPEVFDRACGLVSETFTPSPGARSTANAYLWKDGELWVYYDRDAYYGRLQRFRFDAADHVTEVSWGERHWTRLYAFNPHEPINRTRYDAAGHLVELATIEGTLEDVYLTQRWDGDRLVARSETRNRFTLEANDYVKETLETNWSYLDGRLSEATAVGFGHVWSVAYGYDALGRLVELVRRRDEAVVERLAFTFDAQNRLASRVLERDARAAQDDGWSPGALDSFGLTTDTDWYGDTWASSVPRLTDLGCLQPPTGLQYGYPGVEPAYELGMPHDERPSGIGFAYGANTYGWNYGDLSWYSHAGVHGLEPEWGAAQLTAIETRYVAGRMVEETVSSPGAALVDSHRERRFDAGRLIEDRMDFTVSLEGYDQVPDLLRSYGRTLAFTWDGPRLVKRTLHDDNLGHLEEQRWTRDAANRWLTHTVLESTPNTQVPRWAGEEPYCPSTGLAAPCPNAPPTRIAMVYERDLDAAGRTIARRALRPDTTGVPTLERDERWSYDDAGRVVLVSHSADWMERFEYDAAGRLVRHLWDYGADASYNGAEETNYDTRGRWISVVNFVNGEVTATRTRTFACE